MQRELDYKMDEGKLISQLVSDLRPEPDRSKVVPVLFRWVSVFVLLVIGSMVISQILSPERRLIDLLIDPAFFMAVIPAVSSAVWAILLTLPGRKTTHWQVITFVMFLIWGSYLAYDIINGTTAKLQQSMNGVCILDVVILAILPLTALFILLRKRFILNKEVAVIALALTASLTGAACAGIICNQHASLHILQEHFVPSAAILLVLIFFESVNRNGRVI
ncbi:MAG: DUF1109 family protein [Leptonema sp. (in: Bacteria)]|nr:DUF1109 family protein [Leptonema sp. (in: bacteria)]